MVLGIISNNTPTEELTKQMFVHKVHDSKTYDLLVAGDSRVYRGVSTKPFKEVLNVEAYNLGFSGGNFETQMFDIIDQKLNKESKQPIIVLGVTPHSLTKHYKPNGHIRELTKMKREEVFTYMYFLRYGSVFSPYSITEIINKISNDKYWKTGFYQVPNIEEGWIASDFQNRAPNSALEPYYNTCSKRDIDSSVMHRFFNQIEGWCEKGYKVYGFIPPSSPNIESLERSYLEFSDRMIVKKFIESGGKWITLDSVYRSYDGSHLVMEDAIMLSNELAWKIESDIVDTIFNRNKDYSANYLPLRKPKMSFYDDFENSEMAFTTIFGDAIGIVTKDKVFYNYSAINTDSILNKKVKKIIVKAMFLTQEANDHFSMVFEVNRGEDRLIYQRVKSKWILKEGEWGSMSLELDLPEDLQAGDVIKSYLYNNKKKEFYIDDIEMLYY